MLGSQLREDELRHTAAVFQRAHRLAEGVDGPAR
jgi:hypothetical protein